MKMEGIKNEEKGDLRKEGREKEGIKKREGKGRD